MVLNYLAGSILPADLLTKCLSRERFFHLRAIMGFVALPLVQAVLHALNAGSNYAILEVCCDANSQIRLRCKAIGVSYRGITQGVETAKVYQMTKQRWDVCLRIFWYSLYLPIAIWLPLCLDLFLYVHINIHSVSDCGGCELLPAFGYGRDSWLVFEMCI